MAKIKKSKRKMVKRTTRKAKVKIPISYFALLFFILIGIFIFGLSKMPNISSTNSIKIHSKILLNKPKEAVKVLITPYPAKPAVSPTFAPLAGYCLRVPVLMYHHIQPEAQSREKGQTSLTVDNGFFDQQMSYLVQAGYTSIFANELTDALRNHTGLPAKSVVITMDDGYSDNFTYALPVLQKYNLKANIMLASGLMGNGDMLTWDQVKGLKSSGLIYFTNHTWSHYAISNNNQEKVNMEIDTGKSVIENQTGQSVNVFTYPYGAFNNNSIAILAQKGYASAFTEIPGQYQCDSFIMTLHRTRVGNSSLLNYGL